MVCAAPPGMDEAAGAAWVRGTSGKGGPPAPTPGTCVKARVLEVTMGGESPLLLQLRSS